MIEALPPRYCFGGVNMDDLIVVDEPPLRNELSHPTFSALFLDTT
jgi:hypothetical protein